MSNIKILHPEVLHNEEFSAVRPYPKTSFGGKINNSANHPTISHNNFRRSGADVSLGIEGWSTDPEAVRIAVVLATAASLALPIPALIAGFIRLRGWRPRSWLRIAAWAGAWIAGFALMYQAEIWGNYPANCPAIGGPGNCPAIGSPAVVSWGELGICAAWLVLGAVMTSILAGPAHRWDGPDTSSRPSAKPAAGRPVP